MNSFNITTECYIRRGDDMLFILKGRDDMNTGKYLGVGGHMEIGESPVDCILREIEEETGIVSSELKDLKMRAVITFINPKYGDEYIHLFEAEYIGSEDPALRTCDEGEFKWVNIRDIPSLPMWEGDMVMFEQLLNTKEFFSLKLIYDGDFLKETKIY